MDNKQSDPAAERLFRTLSQEKKFRMQQYTEALEKRIKAAAEEDQAKNEQLVMMRSRLQEVTEQIRGKDEEKETLLRELRAREKQIRALHGEEVQELEEEETERVADLPILRWDRGMGFRREALTRSSSDDSVSSRSSAQSEASALSEAISLPDLPPSRESSDFDSVGSSKGSDEDVEYSEPPVMTGQKRPKKSWWSFGRSSSKAKGKAKGSTSSKSVKLAEEGDGNKSDSEAYSKPPQRLKEDKHVLKLKNQSEHLYKKLKSLSDEQAAKAAEIEMLQVPLERLSQESAARDREIADLLEMLQAKEQELAIAQQLHDSIHDTPPQPAVPSVPEAPPPPQPQPFDMHALWRPRVAPPAVPCRKQRRRRRLKLSTKFSHGAESEQDPDHRDAATDPGGAHDESESESGRELSNDDEGTSQGSSLGGESRRPGSPTAQSSDGEDATAGAVRPDLPLQVKQQVSEGGVVGMQSQTQPTQPIGHVLEPLPLVELSQPIETSPSPPAPPIGPQDAGPLQRDAPEASPAPQTSASHPLNPDSDDDDETSPHTDAPLDPMPLGQGTPSDHETRQDHVAPRDDATPRHLGSLRHDDSQHSGSSRRSSNSNGESRDQFPAVGDVTATYNPFDGAPAGGDGHYDPHPYGQGDQPDAHTSPTYLDYATYGGRDDDGLDEYATTRRPGRRAFTLPIEPAMTADQAGWGDSYSVPDSATPPANPDGSNPPTIAWEQAYSLPASVPVDADVVPPGDGPTWAWNGLHYGSILPASSSSAPRPAAVDAPWGAWNLSANGNPSAGGFGASSQNNWGADAVGVSSKSAFTPASDVPGALGASMRTTNRLAVTLPLDALALRVADLRSTAGQLSTEARQHVQEVQMYCKYAVQVLANELARKALAYDKSLGDNRRLEARVQEAVSAEAKAQMALDVHVATTNLSAAQLLADIDALRHDVKRSQHPDALPISSADAVEGSDSVGDGQLLRLQRRVKLAEAEITARVRDLQDQRDSLERELAAARGDGQGTRQAHEGATHPEVLQLRQRCGELEEQVRSLSRAAPAVAGPTPALPSIPAPATGTVSLGATQTDRPLWPSSPHLTGATAEAEVARAKVSELESLLRDDQGNLAALEAVKAEALAKLHEAEQRLHDEAERHSAALEAEKARRAHLERDNARLRGELDDALTLARASEAERDLKKPAREAPSSPALSPAPEGRAKEEHPQSHLNVQMNEQLQRLREELEGTARQRDDALRQVSSLERELALAQGGARAAEDEVRSYQQRLSEAKQQHALLHKSVTDARAEVAALAAQLERTHRPSHPDRTVVTTTPVGQKGVGLWEEPAGHDAASVDETGKVAEDRDAVLAGKVAQVRQALDATAQVVELLTHDLQLDDVSLAGGDHVLGPSQPHSKHSRAGTPGTPDRRGVVGARLQELSQAVKAAKAAVDALNEQAVLGAVMGGTSVGEEVRRVVEGKDAELRETRRRLTEAEQRRGAYLHVIGELQGAMQQSRGEMMRLLQCVQQKDQRLRALESERKENARKMVALARAVELSRHEVDKLIVHADRPKSTLALTSPSDQGQGQGRSPAPQRDDGDDDVGSMVMSLSCADAALSEAHHQLSELKSARSSDQARIAALQRALLAIREEVDSLAVAMAKKEGDIASKLQVYTASSKPSPLSAAYHMAAPAAQ